MEILTQRVSSRLVRELAAEVGFELAGVTAGGPAPDFERFRGWMRRGLAGEMKYLTDHRAAVRADLRELLPGIRSVVVVGKRYAGGGGGGMAAYAAGPDYHLEIRRGLEELASRLGAVAGEFGWRACVDTAPVLERSLGRKAGLGWIGRNTCLINQQLGSFFLLGELLTTLDIEGDTAPPDRCGTCRRCIEACPTTAIVPSPDGGFELDARVCISYFTIELKGSIPEQHRAAIGGNVFGCDICQDVCPWNRRHTSDGVEGADLLELAGLSAGEYKDRFRDTAVSRTKYGAFLRNVAVAMGNSGEGRFLPALERMAESDDPIVAEHAQWGLERVNLDSTR